MELDCVDSIGKVLKVVFKYQLVLRPGGGGIGTGYRPGISQRLQQKAWTFSCCDYAEKSGNDLQMEG